MGYHISRILQLLSTLIIVLTIVNTEETTKDRIQKHRAWLNQRAYDRQLVGYVETNDPYQKIKYFKKLIKFKNKHDHGNEVIFVPHSGKYEKSLEEEAKKFQNLSPNSMDSGNNFSYDIISTNDVQINAILNGTEAPLLENISNEILIHNTNIVNETIEKQKSNITIDSSTNMNQIEIEQVGNKIDDDVDIHNNSTIRNGKNSFKNSKKSSNDSFNDFEIQKFINEHAKYNSYNMTIKKIWSKWSSWSNCSRTCGNGIKSQSRECVLKMYQGGKKINSTIIPLHECIGIYKRFHVCNEKKCSTEIQDFRSQQCSEFNNQSFRGIKYEWEPYIKDGAECELNCKPINQKYFARLREHVVDGTECMMHEHLKNKYENFDRAVCIEGKCKVVLKNGIIYGSSVNTGNVRCGNSVCKPVSQIFAKNQLPNGYVHITTIPATASNITILELQDSINLLALKTTKSEFVINGNYTASPSGVYKLGGVDFEYYKIDGNHKENVSYPTRDDGIKEWITSPGPLFEPVHLMILSQQSNPGVKYEYLLPINFANSEEMTSDSDYSIEENIPLHSKLKAANRQSVNATFNTKKKRKFFWKVIGFTECSKSCGGGIQHPIIRCVRGEDGNGKIYSRKKCANLKHPTISDSLMKCNIQPCPAFWKVSDWTTCKCEGIQTENISKTREVKCVQELISGIVIHVNAGACSENKPVSSLPCECIIHTGKLMKLEKSKSFQNYSILQQQNTQSDQKIFIARNNKMKPSKSKKTGIWLISDWSEECLGECGLMGQQFRTIFCDRSSPNMERCDIRLTPNVYKECVNEAEECQQGSWFIGPWSKCIGDCWNASRSRTVICIKNDGFAEENECNLSNKPATFEDCKTEEMKDCKAKWHFSEWTECSKSCGNGMQKRTVKCLEIDANDRTLRESKNCKYSGRPSSMKYCNSHDCSETSTGSNLRVDMIQNDDPQCKDRLSNCHAVLQKSNLCAYHYYNENCCQSCRSNIQ